VSSPYAGDPTSSRQDEVRFLLQDLGSPPLLSDAEIDYLDARLLDLYNDPVMTAAFCADMLAHRYATEIAISADGVSAGLNELQSKYEQLGANLRAMYKALRGVGGAPLVGGIDRNPAPDPTVRPLNFGVGMHDNARAGDQGNPQPVYTGQEYESGR